MHQPQRLAAEISSCPNEILPWHLTQIMHTLGTNMEVQREHLDAMAVTLQQKPYLLNDLTTGQISHWVYELVTTKRLHPVRNEQWWCLLCAQWAPRRPVAAVHLTHPLTHVGYRDLVVVVGPQGR